MRILKITDNGGSETPVTSDRYAVYLIEYNGPGDLPELVVLLLSDDCDKPNGLSTFRFHQEHEAYEAEDDMLEHIENNLMLEDDVEISWDDLPANVQRHIVERLLL